MSRTLPGILIATTALGELDRQSWFLVCVGAASFGFAAVMFVVLRRSLPPCTLRTALLLRLAASHLAWGVMWLAVAFDAQVPAIIAGAVAMGLWITGGFLRRRACREP